MDIGKETREYEFEPLETDVPAPVEPAAPAPVEPTPVREPQPV